MQQQTGQKANATYNIQNKSNAIHSNDSNLIDYQKNHQIYEQKELEGTPFKLIKKLVNEKDKYFIAMGDHRLTDMVSTEKEALELLVTDYWKIVVNVIAVVTDITIKEATKYKEVITDDMTLPPEHELK